MGSADSVSSIPMIELPPELFTQWLQQVMTEHGTKPGTVAAIVAQKAAQWAADQELEACCKCVSDYWGHDPDHLRAARRPKPPSLKEQALLQLDTLNADLAMHGRGCDLSQIRRALEALPDG
jgi:hypothetical protein